MLGFDVQTFGFRQWEAKGKPKCYTKEFNGSQEAKGLWWLSNIGTKTRPFSVETYNQGQNTLRRYFIDYS